MKSPKYFISSRSRSADLLAADLVLAFAERYPKAEGHGIVGTETKKTRINGILDLNDCLKNRIHEAATPHWDSHGQRLLADLIQRLDQISFQVAILVGYSPFHDEIATYFKGRQVPVVLYGMTPAAGWQGIDLGKVKNKIDQVLGLFPKPGSIEVKASLPYRYVGSPFYDRAERVNISRISLGLPLEKKIIAFLPGSEIEVFQKLFPTMLQLAIGLSRSRSDLHLVLPLSSSIRDMVKEKILDPQKVTYLPSKNSDSDSDRFFYDPLTIVESMTLEILSVSHLAITGEGGASLEACLFKTPVLALHQHAQHLKGLYCLVNQVWDRPLVDEFSYEDDVQAITTKALALIEEGSDRQRVLQNFEELRSGLQGAAAKKAVEIIGDAIALWGSKQVAKSDRMA